jgi:hypothetical protein
MRDKFLDLKRVNWQHGMLLAPDHFLQQERYLESCLRWHARYCLSAAGLLGEGVRNPSGEVSQAVDPVVSVMQDESQLKIAVTQLRAIPESGQIFEVDESNPAVGEFSLESLEGMQQVDIYVITDPSQVAETGDADSINFDMVPYRVQKYRVALNLDDDDPFASRVLVARLVRPERRSRFELLTDFIPPCATVSAHSGMAAAWKKTLEELTSIADFYIELHRSIVEYMFLCEGKSVDLTVDRETLDFVARMVVALEHCIYEILDPSTPPSKFLQELYRIVRSSAVFLELSPPTRTYFQSLAEVGETEFLPLVQQQLGTLRLDRRWRAQQNLKAEIEQLGKSLSCLRRLAEALGGKYLDYRLSPSLEALGFVIDRDRQSLYKAVNKAMPAQMTPTDRTFVFARLKLSGRERYRVILIGDPSSNFTPGEEIKAGIRINVGSGTANDVGYQSAVCDISGQRNFAIDFETREVGEITDVRVTIRSDHPIRSSMLYVKKFLFAEKPVATQSQQPDAPPSRPQAPEPRPVAPQPIPRPIITSQPTPRTMTPQPMPRPVTPEPAPRRTTRIMGPPRKPDR